MELLGHKEWAIISACTEACNDKSHCDRQQASLRETLDNIGYPSLPVQGQHEGTKEVGYLVFDMPNYTARMVGWWFKQKTVLTHIGLESTRTDIPISTLREVSLRPVTKHFQPGESLDCTILFLHGRRQLLTCSFG